MAPSDVGATDRAWRALSLSLTALTHGAALAGDLLDGDRLLLVRNPSLHSFAGLATLISEGRVFLRGAALPVRDRSPVAALSTWLSWEWFRASPVVQHALGVALLIAVVAALASLLRSRKASPAAAWLGALALSLHPCTADLTGPVLGRDPLLALLIALVAARRIRHAALRPAVAWSAVAALVAGLCAPGYGLLGLIPAALAASAIARRGAAVAVLVATVVTLGATHSADPLLPSITAVSTGAVATLLAWLPSPAAFVAVTLPRGLAVGLLPAVALAAFAFIASIRAREPDDAALLRAGSAAALASLLSAAASVRASTADGTSALLLHLSITLVALAVLRAHRAALSSRARPWMLLGLALPAALTAHRVRQWSTQERVLDALIARDPDDPEALLARATLALRRGRLSDAAPWCLRYGAAMTTTARADGCVGALAVARGDERAAVFLLRRWATTLDDRRALRAAALLLSDAMPDPRLGAAFRAATGYSLPQRRPGEAR